MNSVSDGTFSNKCTVGVCINLSKAFVSVEHSILLKKTGILWYKYLSNRKQFILINDEKNIELEKLNVVFHKV